MPLPRTLPPLPPTPASHPPLQPAGDRAWDTVLGAYAPVMRGEAVTDAAVYSVVLQIPLEGEHILIRVCVSEQWVEAGAGTLRGSGYVGCTC